MVLQNKWVGISSFVFAFLMGISRIYVGVHYPTDVMAGWSLGISIFVVAVLVMEYLQKRRTEKAA
jgi:undecaprenyl-diphosphatase